MKRVLTVLFLFLVPLLAFSENKIKMVTYFPVPYVAYSKINASKQLDVGLTSACEMNLGCAESGALGKRPLQATTVNLNKGRLDLNEASAVKSTNVTLGSGSGEANIDFSKNLRIGTLNNGYSLESNDMTVDELKLFASHMRAGGEKFPSCASTGASGAPQISWQKVKLKNAEEVYLVCGTAKDSEQDPCPAGKVLENGVCVCANTVEKDLCMFEVTCADGSTSMQTWNETTCQCEDSCPEPSDKPHYLRCSRLSYQDAAMGEQNQTHSSKAAAQQACETFGMKNVSYYEVHYPTMDCPAPNKPCTTTPGWGARWYCTDEYIPCGAGIGQCDPCSCYCGVG